MWDILPTSAVLDLPLIYPVVGCMDLVQCRNGRYCESFSSGMFEDLNAHSCSAPWYMQSRHLQWPTPLGELKLLLFTEPPLHPNVLCAVLGILLLTIRLSCGNSSLKVNFLLNECSYGHGWIWEMTCRKKKTTTIWLSFSPGHPKCKNVSPIQTKCHCCSLNKMTSSSSAEAAELSWRTRENTANEKREKGEETLINWFQTHNVHYCYKTYVSS